MIQCDHHRGKRRFKSRHLAQRSIDVINSRHARQKSTRKPVRPYRCRACDGWFLTSMAGEDHDDYED